MNNVYKIASATFVSALAFGAEAYATNMPSMADFPHTAQQLRITKDPRINVITASALTKDDDPNNFISRISPSSHDARQLQAAALHNASLRQELKAQNVEIENIIYASEAADGSFVIVVH